MSHGIYNSERKVRVNGSFKLYQVLHSFLRQCPESPHLFLSSWLFFKMVLTGPRCPTFVLQGSFCAWLPAGIMEQWAVELQLDSRGKATTLISKEYKKMGTCKTVSRKSAEGMYLSWLSLASSVCCTQPPRVFSNKRVCWHAAPWEYTSQQVSLRDLVSENPTSSVSVIRTGAGGTRRKITLGFPCLGFACRRFETLNARKSCISSQRNIVCWQAVNEIKIELMMALEHAHRTILSCLVAVLWLQYWALLLDKHKYRLEEN